MNKLYVVGDSTLAKFNDASYYFPRHGYGVLLPEFIKGLEIINLAMSGRSSKSFLLEPNYQTFVNGISKGDYLIIGFGHNDEKEDDVVRFSSALYGKDKEGSFKNVLYEKYIKVAKEKGATPILCTPISRLSKTDDYTGFVIHDTINGNYKNAIIELGKELGVTTINLTDPTVNLYKKLGYNNSVIHHAITKGKIIDNKITYDIKSTDNTHLSYYGAKYICYFLINELYDKMPEFREFIYNKKEPTQKDIIVNPEYQFIEYHTPDLDNYNPTDNFNKSNDWYGTAFGMLGAIPNKESGFVAYKDGNDFIVGCDKPNGKINASNEGYSFMFKRINKTDNFTFSCHAKIIKTLNIRQSGFGIMLRSDSYINQNKPNMSYQTNHISSGIVTTDGVSFIIFSREATTELDKGNYNFDGFYKENDELDLKIKRLGQVIEAYCKYNDKEYKKVFTDFDITSVDLNYLFVGMFSTNGTVVRYSDLYFNIDGKTIEA